MGGGGGKRRESDKERKKERERAKVWPGGWEGDMIVHNRKETERRVTGLGGGGCRGCLREGGG